MFLVMISTFKIIDFWYVQIWVEIIMWIW
jgi:hypothetical protein